MSVTEDWNRFDTDMRVAVLIPDRGDRDLFLKKLFADDQIPNTSANYSNGNG
jgi:hypothetical protein